MNLDNAFAFMKNDQPSSQIFRLAVFEISRISHSSPFQKFQEYPESPDAYNSEIAMSESDTARPVNGERAEIDASEFGHKLIHRHIGGVRPPPLSAVRLNNRRIAPLTIQTRSRSPASATGSRFEAAIIRNGAVDPVSKIKLNWDAGNK